MTRQRSRPAFTLSSASSSSSILTPMRASSRSDTLYTTRLSTPGCMTVPMANIAPTVMVAVEAVYGMLSAISPLRAMLYVPGGHGMVALLRLKGCLFAQLYVFRRRLWRQVVRSSLPSIRALWIVYDNAAIVATPCSCLRPPRPKWYVFPPSFLLSASSSKDSFHLFIYEKLAPCVLEHSRLSASHILTPVRLLKQE